MINFRTCSILEGVIKGSLATISSSSASTSVLQSNKVQECKINWDNHVKYMKFIFCTAVVDESEG